MFFFDDLLGRAHQQRLKANNLTEIYNRFLLPVSVKRGSDVLIVSGIWIGRGRSGTGGRGPTTAQRQILNGEGAAGRGGHLLVQPLLVLKVSRGYFY
jgi:hypothetical protein